MVLVVLLTEVEYNFQVNEKDKDKIIDAIGAKLTSITEQNILKVLEIESENESGIKASQNEIKNELQENKIVEQEIKKVEREIKKAERERNKGQIDED